MVLFEFCSSLVFSITDWLGRADEVPGVMKLKSAKYAIDNKDYDTLERVAGSGLNFNHQYFSIEPLGPPVSILHYAAWMDDPTAIKVLVNNGGEVGVAQSCIPGDHLSYTPLQIAVIYNNMEALEALRELGAGKIQKDNSLIHLSLLHKPNIEIISYLIENGLSSLSKDRLHRDPLDLLLELIIDSMKSKLFKSEEMASLEGDAKNQIWEKNIEKQDIPKEYFEIAKVLIYGGVEFILEKLKTCSSDKERIKHMIKALEIGDSRVKRADKSKDKEKVEMGGNENQFDEQTEGDDLDEESSGKISDAELLDLSSRAGVLEEGIKNLQELMQESEEKREKDLDKLLSNPIVLSDETQALLSAVGSKDSEGSE